ncbi:MULTISPECIES: terminase small subunit [unclassified Haematobacter]|uniref:terminase small subunit n=1 Tax=unclassified Haematobacter TaxID=2640585 RepID=UPI0025B99291|nr:MULTISPECIES: terminase small subunit [unclassified Haematobacter]
MTRRKSAGAQPELALTEKQEAFALAYFETGNAAEAYRKAYDVAENARDGWLYVEACQLLDNPKITLRLERLREEAERLSIYTRRAAMDEYEKARQVAESALNPSAMVSAINGKVKLWGLEVPTKARIEHTGKGGGPIQTEEVSARDKIASRLARLAPPEGASGDTGKPE